MPRNCSVPEKAFLTIALSALVCLGLSLLLVLCPTRALADECPAGGDHDYEVTILRYATESEDGIRQYTCKKCGYTFTNSIPATGHQWSDWMVYQAPTCTSDGIEYRVCTRYPDNPHYEYRTVPALSPTYEHSYVETSRTEPTCTESGSVTYTCSVCGDTYTETLGALGHDWGEWVVDREPTSAEPGSEHRTCLRDSSHVEYQDIPVVAAAEPATSEPATPEPAAEEPPVEVEKPEPNAFWTLQPNELDQQLLVVDGAASLAFAISIAPMATPLLWIRRKKKEAREAFQQQGESGAIGAAGSGDKATDVREGDGR